MIYEIQANAKASLSVPGRKPSNTLFSLLCPCFSPEDPKIESLNGIFGVQNITSLEDMGACSSNESIIAIRWKFSCLKIRFEKIISDWLSIDKSSQRGIFNNTLNDWSSLLGGSGNGYFVLRTDVFLRINDRCDVVLLLLNHGSLVTHIWHIYQFLMLLLIRKSGNISILVRALTWQQQTSLVYQVALLKWNKCYLWLMFSGSPWIVGAWFVYSTLHKRGIMSGSLLDLNTLEALLLISIFQPRDARRCGESSWSWSQLRGEGTWVVFVLSHEYLQTFWGQKTYAAS